SHVSVPGNGAAPTPTGPASNVATERTISTKGARRLSGDLIRAALLPAVSRIAQLVVSVRRARDATSENALRARESGQCHGGRESNGHARARAFHRESGLGVGRMS